MSLTAVPICCACPEHQRPRRNEDGWVLTGILGDSSTWEAWKPEEWDQHCQITAMKRAANKRRKVAA